LEEGRPTSLGALFRARATLATAFLAKPMNSEAIGGSPLTFVRDSIDPIRLKLMVNEIHLNQNLTRFVPVTERLDVSNLFTIYLKVPLQRYS
jgi:hypothetical protein